MAVSSAADAATMPGRWKARRRDQFTVIRASRSVDGDACFPLS
jgi:hypothetical protein